MNLSIIETSTKTRVSRNATPAHTTGKPYAVSFTCLSSVVPLFHPCLTPHTPLV